MSDHPVSPERAERLHAWLAARCPGSLDDPEILTGLLAVVETEIERAVRERCWKWVRKAGTPCSN